MKANKLELGVPVMSSAEDLNKQALQFFGVPSGSLAKFMLPVSEEMMCNQCAVMELVPCSMRWFLSHYEHLRP